MIEVIISRLRKTIFCENLIQPALCTELTPPVELSHNVMSVIDIMLCCYCNLLKLKKCFY